MTTGTCRACGKEITFQRVPPKGKWCPFDVDGTIHFLTCEKYEKKRQYEFVRSYDDLSVKIRNHIEDDTCIYSMVIDFNGIWEREFFNEKERMLFIPYTHYCTHFSEILDILREYESLMIKKRGKLNDGELYYCYSDFTYKKEYQSNYINKTNEYGYTIRTFSEKVKFQNMLTPKRVFIELKGNAVWIDFCKTISMIANEAANHD